MSITEISVKRPAAITMVVVLLLGLGIFGYSRIGANLMPATNRPVISIMCSYSGAGSEDVKKDIVKPIENAVSTISGVESLSSSARVGSGSVMITFTMETDMNAAMMDVSKAMESVSGRLPDQAGKPMIFKFDSDDAPVMTLSVNSSTIPYEELYNRADKIKQQLEHLNGIGSVNLSGARTKDLYITLDKTVLDFYGINLNTLLNKIRSDNSTSPVGQLRAESGIQTLRLNGEFSSVNDINNLLIPIAGNKTIRLADVAKIEFGYGEQEQYVRINGNNTIGISIQKQSDVNVIEVVAGVKKELKEITGSLPEGVNLTVLEDSTTFIESALKEIKGNLIEGIITTSLVLFLFLRSWRSSLIVLVAIPTSLISAFFMMYINKFSMNIMSLMGLSLCVGILVDDSIVILENIERHLHMGKSRITAAIEGRKEMGMAAIAITLCDVVVFAPVAFMSGMTGQYFREFGLTVVFATLFSLFISFTVTPMLASKLLKSKPKEELALANEKKKGLFHKPAAFFAKGFNFANTVYKKLLIWSLNNRWKVVCLLLVLVTASISLLPLKIIKTEYMPQADDSKFTIRISLTPGSTLEMTNEKIKQIEEFLKKVPEVTSVYANVGGGSDKSTGSVSVRLVPKTSRQRTITQIIADVRRMGQSLTGVSFSVSQSQVVNLGGGGGGGGGISINVSGPETDGLKEIAVKVEQTLREINGIADVSNPFRSSETELVLKINRLAASQYGISSTDLTSILRTATQGSTLGTYHEAGNEYDILVKFTEGQVKTPYDIGNLRIVTPSGKQIAINQVAEIDQADAPKNISRLDKQDTVRISASAQGNVDFGSLNEEVKAKLGALAMPYGYSISFGGTQKQMDTAFSALGLALAISIVLVYMVLVVLYESYMTPLIRMFSLPCAAIGAFGILALTKNTLNMMTIIGLIMLDGLASKNGTLLIDYTNTVMKRGVPLKEALIEAGTTRLRPIIMTTVTMIIGMLPSALTLGDGSELKRGMAIVVIGGMITSTLFTPIILPVVYTIMNDIKTFFSRKPVQNSNVTEVSHHEA